MSIYTPMDHMMICNELNKMFEHKNADYGDSCHKTFQEEGWAAFRIRLSDKLNRFKQLTMESANVKDESIRDTLLDLANYAILAAMELDHEDEPTPVHLTAASSKLNEQEKAIANMVGATYVSRDSEDDSMVEFWNSQPLKDDYGDVFYYVDIDSDHSLARIDANLVGTSLMPGECLPVK